MRICVLLIIAFLPIFTYARQDTEINLQIEKDEVQIDEKFQIVISFKSASTEGIDSGQLNVPGLNNFRIVGKSDSTQFNFVNNTSLIVSEYKRTLIAEKSGDFVLGPISVDIKDGNNGHEIIKSNFVNIKVSDKSVDVNNIEEDGIVDDNNLKKSNKIQSFNVWIIIKNISLIALFIFLIYSFYVLRYRKKINLKSKKEKVKYKKKNTINIPKVNSNFFREAKENILIFINQKYKIKISSKTSKEILEILEKKDIKFYNKTKKIIELCDVASFSKSEEDKNKIISLMKKL